MVRRIGRLGGAVLALLVGLGGALVLPAEVVGAAPAASSGVSVDRFGQADRYATSLLIAEAVVADAGFPLPEAADPSSGRVKIAVLALGESITVAGHTIAVTADSGDTYTVTITRAEWSHSQRAGLPGTTHTLSDGMRV